MLVLGIPMPSFQQSVHFLVAAAFALLGLRASPASPLYLAPVCAALSFDNAVLFFGTYIGRTPSLAMLSRVRYFAYVMTMPLVIPGVVDVASRGGVAWVGAHAKEMALALSVAVIALFAAREAFAARNHWGGGGRAVTKQGWLAPPSQDDEAGGEAGGGGGGGGGDTACASTCLGEHQRPGDCLASTALLGGTFTIEDGGKKDGDHGILRYVPATPRPHDRAPAGFAVLLSLVLGYSLFAATGRAYLLLGGLAMVGTLVACSTVPAVRKWGPHVGEVLWVGFVVAESAR